MDLSLRYKSAGIVEKQNKVKCHRKAQTSGEPHLEQSRVKDEKSTLFFCIYHVK